MRVFVLTVCKYDLRRGDLFVLSWVRVRRVCLESVSSVVFIGGGCVCSILLFCRFVTMVVCIVAGLVFMSCSGMVLLLYAF